MNKLILVVFILFSQVSCAQDKIERKETLNTYDGGQIMREHIKFQNNDTIIENVYFENGQLNFLYRLVNGKRNGKSLVYLENGDLVFEQYYSHGKLNDEFKSFYPDGTIQRTENYRLDNHVDTAIYYNETGTIIRKVIYKIPCEFGSSECNKMVIEYQNGTRVYSYEITKGWKSEDHIIYNHELYNELMQSTKEIPKLDKGKALFRANCAMCHSIDKPIVGPALNKAIKDKTDNQLYEIIVNSNSHPSSKLSKEEFDALMEFLKTKKSP
ncbi:MAG: c-type cytochrome [Flavobacteriales bacterium]